MWEVKRIYIWSGHSNAALNEVLAEGWEPFAATADKEGEGATYFLRRAQSYTYSPNDPGSC
jgi:hypothetical protein